MKQLVRALTSFHQRWLRARFPARMFMRRGYLDDHIFVSGRQACNGTPLNDRKRPS